MVRDVDTHKPDPHFDGKYESIINDPLASASKSVGIYTDIDPENLKEGNSPFHFKPKVDPEMAKFEKFFRGDKASKE